MANPITSGLTSNGIVLTNDNLSVNSGGTVTSAIVNDGGALYLEGYSDSATLNNGGQMTILTGGIADHTVVNPGAGIVANPGGLARQTKLAGGGFYLLEQSTASDTEVQSGGQLDVLAQAVAAGVTVGAGGVLNVNDGATATQIVENGGIVNFWGNANVSFAKHTIENFSIAQGTATLHSGTTAANAVITQNGKVDVYDGGLVLSGTLSNCTTAGGLYLFSGGAASAMTVAASGIVDMYEGASINGVTVEAGGTLSIRAGATVTGLIDNGGTVYIYDGANVTYGSNVISGMILSSGIFNVRSGTTLTNAAVSKDGSINVCEGGLFLSGSAGSMTTVGGLCISSGGVASATAIGQGAIVYVQSGGSAVACNLEGGNISMNPGAIVSTLTMNSGFLTVAENAILSNSVIRGGTTYFLEGSTAEDITLSTSGMLTVRDGAVVNGLTVQQGATLIIDSGATVTGLKDYGGAVTIVDGANVTFAANIVNNVVVSSSEYAVFSGTILKNAVVTKDGKINVNDGGVVEDTIVSACNAAGYMGLYVFNGGSAVNMQVKSGGAVYLYDYSNAVGGVVSSGGVCQIRANATVQDIVVQPGGTLSVAAGATVTGLKDLGGSVYIDPGANVELAVNVIENADVTNRSQDIRSGTTLTKSVIGNNGAVSIHDGGVVQSSTISNGGVIYVNAGGNTIDCTVNNGTLRVNAGGTATGTTMTAGLINVEANAILTDTLIKGGTVYVLENGTANDTELGNSANFTVCTGAVANGITVQQGATLFIQDGATVTGLKNMGGYVSIAPNATVEYAANVIDGMIKNSGDYTVFSGTILTNAVVTGDGNINVNAGGVVEDTVVSACNAASYKGLYVNSGGSAVNTQIKSGGAVYLYDHGSALGGVVSSGGVCQIRENSFAQDLVVMPGGTIGIASGATVTGLKDYGGSVSIAAGATVTYASIVIENTVVNSRSQDVRSGTTLTKAVVGSSGTISIHDGGVVQSSTINTGGVIYVNAGGSAIDCTVNNGTLRVNAGGTAQGTTLTAGLINVEADAIMTDTLINGGTVYVFAKGTANATVIGNTARLTVQSGAVANSLTVMPGATLFIESGATVTELKDNGGGYVSIASGASVTYAPNVIDSLVVSDGDYYLRSGTTITKAIIQGNGVINVLDGGVIGSAIINSCNAATYKGLYVSSGGTACQTTVNSGGKLYVYESGFVSGGVVSNGAVCQLREGASASDLTVLSGGSMTIASGAVATNILENGGVVTVDPGATATFVDRIVSGTVINNGLTTIHQGTTMVGTVIGGNGALNVRDGGKVVSTTVNSCGPDGGLVLYSGGTAIGNTMNSGGFAYIFSGATAIDNTINPGGSMTVFSGAVMRNVDVMSDPNYINDPKNALGGTLYLSSGAVLTGRIRVGTEGSYIFINDLGVTIDFDLTEINPSGDQEVLLDDFERIRPQPKTALDHVPLYTVTVSDDQSIGTYKLALANKLPDTLPLITVKNTSGTVLGQLQVTVSGGGSFTYNGVEYRIDHRMEMTSQTTGYVTLYLHVGDGADAYSPVMPTVSVDASATTGYKKSVTVTATFDSSLSTRQYSLDGTNWLAYENGVTMTENGRVYFRGLSGTTPSGIASYTVRNIDNTAPTSPSELSATVSGRTVTMSWRPATDDLAGVREYVVSYSHDGQSFTARTTDTQFVLEDADYASWQWSVQAVDNVGNVSSASAVESFQVEDPLGPGPEPPAPSEYVAKFDVDGNGISDVMFVWTGYNYAHGYWMNGTNEWRSTLSDHPAEWENLGCYDMTGDGKADSVLVGNAVIDGNKGAYIGYYADAVDAIDGSTWCNIDNLNNAADVVWINKIGNLTGGTANSIIWYAPDLYTLGAWTDGTSSWTTITGTFGGDWTMLGCGDFDGDGRDSIVMTAGGAMYYAADLDGTVTSMGAANWSGWEVRAIGDFKGDGKDDLVMFHKELGSLVMLADGNLDAFESIGQLNAADWFVVGAGDYNGDRQDDLLVRQYSTGMLGYYSGGDVANGWVELGRGVDMNWTVIA